MNRWICKTQSEWNQDANETKCGCYDAMRWNKWPSTNIYKVLLQHKLTFNKSVLYQLISILSYLFNFFVQSKMSFGILKCFWGQESVTNCQTTTGWWGLAGIRSVVVVVAVVIVLCWHYFGTCPRNTHKGLSSHTASSSSQLPYSSAFCFLILLFLTV